MRGRFPPGDDVVALDDFLFDPSEQPPKAGEEKAALGACLQHTQYSAYGGSASKPAKRGLLAIALDPRRAFNLGSCVQKFIDIGPDAPAGAGAPDAALLATDANGKGKGKGKGKSSKGKAKAKGKGKG